MCHTIYRNSVAKVRMHNKILRWTVFFLVLLNIFQTGYMVYQKFKENPTTVQQRLEQSQIENKELKRQLKMKNKNLSVTVNDK